MYYAKGSAKNPFTDEEINEKFRGLALPMMDKQKVDTIVQMAENLEDVKNVAEFGRLFA
jgi:2-methylcitrate dehydratase PrpD